MTSCLELVCFVCAVVSAAPGSQEIAGRGESPPREVPSREVASGYVIAHGRYVPPPYVLAARGADVLLNGYRVSELPERPARSARPAGPGGRGERGRFSGPSTRMDETAAKLSRMARWLENGAALIVEADGELHVIPSDDAIHAVHLLNSDRPAEFKAESLSNSQRSDESVDRQMWAELAHRFVRSEELATRLEQELGPFAHVSDSRSFWTDLGRYGLNVGGMMLVVLAFGALLSNPPRANCACHTCARCGDGSSFVLRNMALVVLLSAFDLGCTLLADGAGSMAELNPLADPLVQTPAVLAAFKLSATMVGATILVGLRQHRRAQLASWWVCLACTLLTLRWVAFHSLVLA